MCAHRHTHTHKIIQTWLLAFSLGITSIPVTRRIEFHFSPKINCKNIKFEKNILCLYFWNTWHLVFQDVCNIKKCRHDNRPRGLFPTDSSWPAVGSLKFVLSIQVPWWLATHRSSKLTMLATNEVDVFPKLGTCHLHNQNIRSKIALSYLSYLHSGGSSSNMVECLKWHIQKNRDEAPTTLSCHNLRISFPYL